MTPSVPNLSQIYLRQTCPHHSTQVDVPKLGPKDGAAPPADANSGTQISGIGDHHHSCGNSPRAGADQSGFEQDGSSRRYHLRAGDRTRCGRQLGCDSGPNLGSGQAQQGHPRWQSCGDAIGIGLGLVSRGVCGQVAGPGTVATHGASPGTWPARAGSPPRSRRLRSARLEVPWSGIAPTIQAV